MSDDDREHDDDRAREDGRFDREIRHAPRGEDNSRIEAAAQRCAAYNLRLKALNAIHDVNDLPKAVLVLQKAFDYLTSGGQREEGGEE